MFLNRLGFYRKFIEMDSKQNLNISRILLAGIAINFISFLVGGGSYFLFGWVFEFEPTNIWKWTPAMGSNIPISWWTLLLVNIILAIIFAFIYAILHGSIPGKGIQKGLIFGLIIWIVGPIPALITMYLMMNIAIGSLLYFTIQSLVEWLVYGITIAAIYKNRKF